MSESTKITLPQSTAFPIRITSLLVGVNDTVKKHDPILRFKYWHEVEEGDEKVAKEFHSTFEVPVAGKVSEWIAEVGDTITTHKTPVILIQEPCTHTVQYGGLCALCGKSTEEQDYSEFKLDRAPITMSHDNVGLKVSYGEAERIEKNSVSRLLKEKKLILVVDLDQTVIHADVDKTIGEWMADETNPNHEACKNIKTFQLYEDVMNNQTRQITRQLCTYYVKLRPGLEEFLQRVHEMYELHVYTMATKAYAKNITSLIDPEGKYFADRVLSRDDSGSMSEKQLKRLFPVSTSMVTIIDDRGDVWKWSPHLVKVLPYNFFQVGDINSSFLPQRQGVIEPAKATPAAETETGDKTIDPSTLGSDNGDSSNSNESLEEERSALLGTQINERPLAKLQEKQWQKEEQQAQENHEQVKHEQVLMKDEDEELTKLSKILKDVHTRYYEAYEPSENATQEPDIKEIIRTLKEPVFSGFVFLFSGVIPLNIDLDKADIVRWVRSFGAVVVADYIDQVTHVIANSPGTKKVLQASRNKKVKIVKTDWIFKCVYDWKRYPEDDYLLEVQQQHPQLEHEEQEGEVARQQQNQQQEQEQEGPPQQNGGSRGGRGNEDDPDIDPEQFMQKLNDGKVDWDEVNKEVDDFLGSDDEDSDDDDEESDGDSLSKKRSRSKSVESQSEPDSAKRARTSAELPNNTTTVNDNDDNTNNNDDDDYDEDEFAKELEEGFL